MEALRVTGLSKRYPSFILDDISFSVEKGKITGLIGRNGAGKSTTIKAIMGLVAPTTGEVLVFGRDMAANETELKQKIGFVAGGFDYYKLKTLKSIALAIAPLYHKWDVNAYKHYLQLFGIDENKRVKELSEGMKMKFSIALALSHGAELLIMDEPTSGLDPISRDEFCDIILKLNRESRISVLFSTHITSDLEKIADDIIYISNGRLIFSGGMNELLNDYRLVRFTRLSEVNGSNLIGIKERKDGFSALIRTEDAQGLANEPCSLDDVMVHLEVEGCHGVADLRGEGPKWRAK